jgi:hypothetical protein
MQCRAACTVSAVVHHTAVTALTCGDQHRREVKGVLERFVGCSRVQPLAARLANSM